MPEVRHIFPDGDFVVVRFNGSATTTLGSPYRNQFVWIFRMKDGSVIEAEAFLDLVAYQQVVDNNEPRAQWFAVIGIAYCSTQASERWVFRLLLKTMLPIETNRPQRSACGKPYRASHIITHHTQNPGSIRQRRISRGALSVLS